MFQGGRRRMSLDSYGSQYRAPPPYAVSGTAMGWGPQPTTTIIEHQPYSVEHQPYSVISQHRPIPAVTTTTSYVTPLRTSPQKLVSEWQDGVQREYTPQDDGDAWEESAVETADENSDGEQVNSRPSRRRNQRESHRSLGCQNCDDLKHQVADLQREVELLKNELLKTEPQCDECPRLRAEVQRYRQLLERQELRGGADDSLSNYTHDDGNAFRRNNSYDAEKRSNPVIINPPISRQPPAAGQKSRHEPLDITQAFASPSKSLTGAARARGVYAPKDEHVPWNTLPENASSNFARSNSNSIEYDDPMGSIDLCKVLGIRVNVRPTRRGEHDGIIVVKDVNLGSLAERSGIRVNDTIYEWNHRAILTEQTWRSMLSNATYGSVIRFGLLRDGIPYQALVTVPMPSSS